MNCRPGGTSFLLQVPEKQLDENKVRQVRKIVLIAHNDVSMGFSRLHAKQNGVLMLQAMANLASSQAADKEAKRQRERELAAVKINKEDVDVIALELEMDKKVAERKLRENGGSLLDTLKACL